jgi:penicillin-binding protein 1B
MEIRPTERLWRWFPRRTKSRPVRPPGDRRRFVLWGLGGTGLILFAVFLWIDRSTVHRFEARTSTLPSRVYAKPFTVPRGGRIDTVALLARLESLAYEEVGVEPDEPGEFHRERNDWTVFLRTALTPGGMREASPVKLDVSWGRLRHIKDLWTRERLDSFSLEPEPLVTFYADVMEERRWTTLDEIPVDVRQAVEVVEDHRFRRHHGIDVVGIGRALAANVRAGRVVQGGSTITQQLAKNLYGPGERTLRRKLFEAVASVALELHYDKGTILEAYLNEVYLGQLGPVAISGVGDASRFFFGAHVWDLDLSRSALLAGMIRNPGRYNPRRHPGDARERRDLVLRLMHQHGMIEESRLDQALAAPIDVIDPSLATVRFPWIEDYLAGAIAPAAPEAVPSGAGYSIFTTFDPRVQNAARGALEAGLEQLERRVGRGAGDPLEGAIVVLRPADGAVLALVGGRDYRRSQYNRATHARRSPGSTFKPFVFLAGLDRARRDPDFEFTAATVLDDSPLQIRAGGKLWNPANYDRRYRGAVTVRDALEQSINVPTARAALQVGLPDVVAAAHRCGIDSELEAIPALALGAEEVTPLELATAYATLANGGWRVRPHGLEALIDREGVPYDPAVPRPERVMEPELVYLVTNLLEGVFARGTARSAARLGFSGVAAGKTGSSDGLRDAWFVGYTPDLLALVWVGYDDNRPVGLTGGTAALPIWVDLMKRIGAHDADPFPRPSGVVRLRVDPRTGQRATRRCPDARQEIFLRGTEPRERCAKHGGGERRGLWKRLSGRRR